MTGETGRWPSSELITPETLRLIELATEERKAVEAAEAEEDARLIQQAREALTDPVGILAEALAAMQVAGPNVEWAATLARIAEVAAQFHAAGMFGPLPRYEFGDEEDAEEAPGEPAPPEPLHCRFTFTAVGNAMNLGGRPVIFIPYHGWVNVAGWENVAPASLDGTGEVHAYRTTGRAVSHYNGMVLCLPDHGGVLTLPESLVTLEPDE